MSTSEIGELLKSLGPTAAILLVAVTAYWKVFIRQDAEMQRMAKRIGMIEDARLAEAKERLEEFKAVILPHTAAMEKLALAIRTSPCGQAAGVWLDGENIKPQHPQRRPHCDGGSIGFDREREDEAPLQGQTA